MSTIKGVLITPNKEGTKPREYTLELNSYKDFYPLLECDTFEIVTRCFNGHWLDIYCDDEGLFKNNEVSVITTNSKGKIVEQVVGNAFVVSHDDDGETISLTDEEIKAVLSTVQVKLVLRSSGVKSISVCTASI